MAFTGDLEQLHIVDIIQLLNTTRKSGTFSVRGQRGESRIIFSNGYIVGASHLNKVRIGTVLEKTGAITIEDLKHALSVQKKAGRNRKPLMATLMAMGKLGHDAAFRGLRKLIEITMVELIGWTQGTFTLDADVISVSPECSYPLSQMDQEISLDAQMVLMDALRIFDERERDRQSGKPVPSDEELFSDVVPSETAAADSKKRQVISADVLGLGDLDHLERKIPHFSPATEFFDPVEIHRQQIKDLLSGYPVEEQEAFVSFLKRSTVSIDTRDSLSRLTGRTSALVLFSADDLITHSVMTICKDDGVLVFATEQEEELYRILDQCLAIKVLPVLVFDDPGTFESVVAREALVSLRQKVAERYGRVLTVQLSSSVDYSSMLELYHDRIRAVFPRPTEQTRKTAFVADTIAFLETFSAYIRGLFDEYKDDVPPEGRTVRLKDCVSALRGAVRPADLPLSLLQYVSGICERAIIFVVRQAELAGDKAIGVYADKDAGPTSVTRLRVPLVKASLFSDVINSGQLFYGTSSDEVLSGHLFEVIGEPLSPTVLLLPLRQKEKTIAVIYGDFGSKEAPRVDCDELRTISEVAELVLENTLYRKQTAKKPVK
ncbi:MAG: DUF4388 domain-containing protein [Nitrospirae bacterium]|nr:DUF4388 domain-containing protein [Nitrospirota bacterium]